MRDARLHTPAQAVKLTDTPVVEAAAVQQGSLQDLYFSRTELEAGMT